MILMKCSTHSTQDVHPTYPSNQFLGHIPKTLLYMLQNCTWKFQIVDHKTYIWLKYIYFLSLILSCSPGDIRCLDFLWKGKIFLFLKHLNYYHYSNRKNKALLYYAKSIIGKNQSELIYWNEKISFVISMKN